MFEPGHLLLPPVKIKLKELTDELLLKKQVIVKVALYEDGPVALMGNKWHKLKYNLLEAGRLKMNKLLTFGGAYSNHIAATAYAAKIYGYEAIGIIRGEMTLPLNKTLSNAEINGMKLIFETREKYRQKEMMEYMEELKARHGDFYLIPEGGANKLAVKGCSEIVDEINEPFDFICCACGTGSTLAGLRQSLNSNQQAIGINVLKNENYLWKQILMLTAGIINPENVKIFENYHFGGYAKSSPELRLFIHSFFLKHRIQLEHIYTGKMFYALFDLISHDYFKPGSTIIAFHTGGLQYLENDS